MTFCIRVKTGKCEKWKAVLLWQVLGKKKKTPWPIKTVFLLYVPVCESQTHRLPVKPLFTHWSWSQYSTLPSYLFHNLKNIMFSSSEVFITNLTVNTLSLYIQKKKHTPNTEVCKCVKMLRLCHVFLSSYSFICSSINCLYFFTRIVMCNLIILVELT